MLFRLFTLLVFVVLGSMALAQAGGPVPEEEAPAEQDLPEVFDDLGEWEALAQRVEAALSAGRVSTATLDDLRASLTEWRDRFLTRQNTNAARIETLRQQIAALGEATEGEDPRVVARRDELNSMLEDLRAPRLLAAAAHARASGLISQIDAQIRSRQAAALTERVQSPLDPTGWGQTLAAFNSGYRLLRAEAVNVRSSPLFGTQWRDALPEALLSAAAALILLLRGRRWAGWVEGRVTTRSRRGRGVWRFVISLSAVLLPLLGLFLLENAIDALDILGRRGEQVLSIIPAAAILPFFGHWLARLLLYPPVQGAEAALELPEEARDGASRQITVLSVVLALILVLTEFMNATEFNDVAWAVVLFVTGVMLSFSLFRLGRLMRATSDMGEAGGEADETSEKRGFRMVIRRLLGRILTLVSVAGVLAGAAGYVAAFELMVVPAAITLYVLGVLVILQRLSVDLYTLLSGFDDGAQDALIPVLIGFALALMSVPVLALVWGARVTDLTEILARAREGFAIGETRISPTDFLTFVLVFAVGYTVVRLLQGALRSSILPRTKLDIGGRNAIVAGTGYLGIFLAAVIAITTAGIDLSGLAIVAGALSVGIGFGLQNIVSNFVSGIILLIERPISEGDWIQVGTEMGYVRDISVRSTRIETFDRTDVIIPNADLVSGQVTNWTRGNSVGRVIVPVGVAYGTDTARVERILLDVAEGHPLVLANPAPAVIFQGFGADSLDFEIRAILRDVNWVLSVKSEMNHEIAKRFAEEGIEIPFAQRDIWLRNPESLRGRPSASGTDTQIEERAAPRDPADPDADADAGEA
ncbi:MAG: DUF3772 domain-containing protein [Alphaproteobacteria bacterium]|nr:DUF3772 domain-containing protein [Alphaproteobacteria bacterium]